MGQIDQKLIEMIESPTFLLGQNLFKNISVQLKIIIFQEVRYKLQLIQLNLEYVALSIFQIKFFIIEFSQLQQTKKSMNLNENAHFDQKVYLQNSIKQPITEGTKIKRHMLKENTSPSTSINSTIKLNLKKLPADWFSVKKVPQTNNNKQNLSTNRYSNIIKISNPQIVYASQRKIQYEQQKDYLQKTSHFGDLQQNDSKIVSLTTNCQTIQNNQNSKHDVTGELQKLKNSKQQLITNYFLCSLQKPLQNQLSNFQITFSNQDSKKKSFSVKKLKNYSHRQKSNHISQFKLNNQNQRTPNNKYQARKQSKNQLKTSRSNFNIKRRNLSRQSNCRPVKNSNETCFQNTFKGIKETYFQRNELKTKQQSIFKVSQFHLPPIAKKKNNNLKILK